METTFAEKSFGIALIGDLRHRNETEKERERREKRAARRKEEKMHLIDSENIQMKRQAYEVVITVPITFETCGPWN